MTMLVPFENLEKEEKEVVLQVKKQIGFLLMDKFHYLPPNLLLLATEAFAKDFREGGEETEFENRGENN